MNTTLQDLLEAVQQAIEDHGPGHEIALFNAAGDQHSSPIRITFMDDDLLEIQ